MAKLLSRNSSVRELYYLGLYLAVLAIFLSVLATRLHRDDALNGEEIAVGYRNVLFFEHRWIADSYASNYSGQTFFWLVSHLFPVTVASAAIVKVVTMAAIAPILAHVILLAVPGASLFSAAFASIVFAFRVHPSSRTPGSELLDS